MGQEFTSYGMKRKKKVSSGPKNSVFMTLKWFYLLPMKNEYVILFTHSDIYWQYNIHKYLWTEKNKSYTNKFELLLRMLLQCVNLYSVSYLYN